MLQTVEQEPLLRYLLDELSEHERQQVEQRYFTDNEYFEVLLKLEGELFEEYELDKFASENRLNKDQPSEARLEEPGSRFATEWSRGIVESINLPDSPLVAVAIKSYDEQLKRAKDAIKEQEVNNLLAQAWADRQLVSALIDGDWLGLKILRVVSLTSEAKITASDVAVAVNCHIDFVVSLLVRLVQFGALKEDQKLFSLTQRGAAVIKNLDASPTRLS